MKRRIAFWIVSGEKFMDEARVCSSELRAVMPHLEQALFTPDDVDKGDFNRMAKLSPRIGKYWYLDRANYWNLAFDLLKDFDECIYFDTDVNFIYPFPEIFDTLKRFDIAIPMGARRVTGATHEKLPDCFAEYELGVIVFRRNDRVKKLLETWRDLHWAHHEIYGNNSQRSFREAVWNCPDLKIDRLPSEYGLRWPFGEFMSLPVKIIHGRYSPHPLSPTIEDVKRVVNSHDGMRIWSPRDPNWREGTIPRAHD